MLFVMKRLFSALTVLAVVATLSSCDRFEEDDVPDDVFEEERIPTEGAFVATVIGENRLSIAGPATFRIPSISQNRLSLDLALDREETDALSNTQPGVFLSVGWRWQPGEYPDEDAETLVGYVNLMSPALVGRSAPITPYTVTGGTLTLSTVSDHRIEGTFRARARSKTSVPGLDSDAQLTVVGSFIAVRASEK